MFFDLVVLPDIHFKSELLKYFTEKLCTRKYVMTTWKFKKITPISFTGSTKMHFFVCLFIHAALAQLFHKLSSKHSLHFCIWLLPC